jgi:hypothetical protein
LILFLEAVSCARERFDGVSERVGEEGDVANVRATHLQTIDRPFGVREEESRTTALGLVA